MQKLKNGKWEEVEEKDLLDGDNYRKPIGGKMVDGVLVGNGWEQKTYQTPPPDPDPFKMVSMAELGELLPDEVLIELEDFKSTNTVPAPIRQAAARILLRINTNIKVDVFNGKFTNLLNNLVTHTSLTIEQATVISNTLKA